MTGRLPRAHDDTDTEHDDTDTEHDDTDTTRDRRQREADVANGEGPFGPDVENDDLPGGREIQAETADAPGSGADFPFAVEGALHWLAGTG